MLTTPVTSTVRGASTEVAVGPADGVRLPSVANLDYLQLVARTRLVGRVERTRPETLLVEAFVTSVPLCGS